MLAVVDTAQARRTRSKRPTRLRRGLKGALQELGVRRADAAGKRLPPVSRAAS
jgi:hypothetical protein